MPASTLVYSMFAHAIFKRGFLMSLKRNFRVPKYIYKPWSP